MSPLYDSLEIKNFRVLEHLKVDDLQRITLITGKNGAGKTSLLEALWLNLASVNPDTIVRVQTFRGIPASLKVSSAESIFTAHDTDREITFTSSGNWGVRKRQVSIRLEPRPIQNLPVDDTDTSALSGAPRVAESDFQYVMRLRDEDGEEFETAGWYEERSADPRITQLSLQVQSDKPRIVEPTTGLFHAARLRRPQIESAGRLEALEKSKSQDKIIKLLRLVEPNLLSLRALPGEMGQSSVYADIKGEPKLVPTAILGDGFLTIMDHALAIASAPRGLVLIDEFENGIHYSILQAIWKQLAGIAVEYDTQIIASTHSFECLRAAAKAFAPESSPALALFRLDRQPDGGVSAVKYDAEDALFAIESGIEVR